MTTEGETRPLPSPFMVLATQNPYRDGRDLPLPEAQVDRFLVKIDMGYPSRKKNWTSLRGVLRAGHSRSGISGKGRHDPRTFRNDGGQPLR